MSGVGSGEAVENLEEGSGESVMTRSVESWGSVREACSLVGIPLSVSCRMGVHPSLNKGGHRVEYGLGGGDDWAR